MSEITTIGLDLAKHVFQVHGIDAQGTTVLRKRLRRGQVLAFFSRIPRCVVGLEACATALLGAIAQEAEVHVLVRPDAFPRFRPASPPRRRRRAVREDLRPHLVAAFLAYSTGHPLNGADAHLHDGGDFRLGAAVRLRRGLAVTVPRRTAHADFSPRLGFDVSHNAAIWGLFETKSSTGS
jgi:hypothetical protein